MPGQGVLDSTLRPRKIAAHSSHSLRQLQTVPKGPEATSQPFTWSQHTSEFFSRKTSSLPFKG